jgi:hypothetical protein
VPTAVIGLDKTLKALRQLSPELYKGMTQDIKKSMAAVVQDARSMVPNSIAGLSNWKLKEQTDTKQRQFPRYDPAEARNGIKYTISTGETNRNGWKGRYIIYNSSPSGVILETAGRKNPDGRSAVMFTNLKSYGGVYGTEGKRSGKERSRTSFSSNNPFASYQFNHAINNRLPLISLKRGRKNSGRVIFAAVSRNEGRLTKAILGSIDQTVEKANQRISNGS